MSGIVGRTYLEAGQPVEVVAQWLTGVPRSEQGPRNVAIRRPDGTVVVRPFRGLRRVRTTEQGGLL